MNKRIKYGILFVVAILSVFAVAIFLKPSIILNKNNLIRLIDVVGGSTPISYQSIDINITSPTIFNKRIKFISQDLCVKKQAFDICLPNVTADIILAIRTDGIRVVKIHQLSINDGKLKLNIPASKTDDQKVNDETEKTPNVKLSLLLRSLNLFADLSRKDISNLNIKNFSYLVDLKGTLFEGIINFENDPQALTLKIDDHSDGKDLSVFGTFNDNSVIGASLNNDMAVNFNVQANALAEFLEYIKSKEIYRYKQKNIHARLDVKDLHRLLEISDMFLRSKHADVALHGQIGADITLAVNTPKIDDASLKMNIAGNILDNNNRINFLGNMDYSFYQKIPTIQIAKWDTNISKPMPIDHYNTYKFLSTLSQKLDYQVKYHWVKNKLEVVVKKDYSKIPRKLY